MNYNQWDKEFDKRFHHIDVSECGYAENGEPDNTVIVDASGLWRYNLVDVKRFIYELLEERKKVTLVEAQMMKQWINEDRITDKKLITLEELLTIMPSLK